MNIIEQVTPIVNWNDHIIARTVLKLTKSSFFFEELRNTTKAWIRLCTPLFVFLIDIDPSHLLK